MKPTKLMVHEATGPHPRNRHRGRYNLTALAGALPELREWIVQRRGDSTIDFADQRAVLALNRALLAQWYGIRGWELPPAALCPGVPGRPSLRDPRPRRRLSAFAAPILPGAGNRSPGSGAACRPEPVPNSRR